MKKNTLIFLVGAPLLAFILVALRIYYAAIIWQYQGPDVEFQISSNETFASINSRLQNRELIKSARLFHRYSQYKGVLNKFKTGRYVIKHNSNLLKVYSTFINEKSLSSFFTIPEGKNMFEIGRMLEDKQICKYDDFINLARDRQFVKELGIPGHTVEGYLYPDSYDFTPNLPAKNVITQMVKEFNRRTSKVDFNSSHLSKKQVIILASIVEKETGEKSERPIIAGVFFNRLEKKMRLQSDPTTIYGIYENYKGNITKKDLQTESDYNTYTLPSLPIGPISNPGIESINAVLHPDKHHFIYFVSQNNGTTIFTETYDKHQEAVNRWQKTAKNREGKSWRDLNKNN